MTQALIYGNTKEDILQDYWALMKPRVMGLVLFTAMVGMACASGSGGWGLKLIALLAIALGAGAAGAFNMAWEAEADRLMRRTAARPVAAGRLSKEEALTFSGFLTFVALFLLELSAGWQTMLLLAFTIFFYAGIYTRLLKPRTPQNIVIGGLAGALPPVIGWGAGGGIFLPHSLSDFLPWILCVVIFLWTPPHFWSLCLWKQEDYARAPWPMYPQIYGVKCTQKAIGFYTIVTSLVALLPWFISSPSLGWAISGLGILILNGVFCFKGLSLMLSSDPQPRCPTFFLSSIIYLFFYFICILGLRLL